jgi:hypothetical protein
VALIPFFAALHKRAAKAGEAALPNGIEPEPLPSQLMGLQGFSDLL